MKTLSLLQTVSSPLRWVRSRLRGRLQQKTFGLKAKITLLILLNVTGVLFVASYLDFRLSKEAQIELFLDRNLYIAKQIDVSIPDEKIFQNLPHIRDEAEEWLLSRPSLMEIDVFLFSAKEWERIVSHSKDARRTELILSKDQISRLKKDKHLSALREVDDEEWLEVIVPLHSGMRVIGGVRVVSTLDEARSYLAKKRDRTIILTLSSIAIILMTVTLLFGKLVGDPIRKLIEAMTRAEGGDLEVEAHLPSRDELGALGGHFNRMLRTIRETHEQNVQLLSQVSQFNEELRRKITEATSELAKRNEELRLLNEALFESQRELSHSEKLAALGQVAATIAHQIGTPLNSISGYIQLMLQEGNVPLKDRDRLKIIESQLDRLADSVKNLLSMTRQPKPQMRPLDVTEVLRELILLSEPWFLARKVRLVSSLSENLPKVMGDTTSLQTVFLNLLTNALDAMPDGGMLSIRTRSLLPDVAPGNGSWVEVSITDTGIGITEESRKRIFDPFFTTKKVGEGSGLGLAICQKIVKEHAGRLEVESNVGKGSTFFVRVPALRVSPVEEQHVSSASRC